jgi:hypothetical protein
MSLRFMGSEGLLQHYVKTEVFTAYIRNNSSRAIDCFMVELHFHTVQLPDPLLGQKNIFCFIKVLHNKDAEIILMPFSISIMRQHYFIH